MKSGDDVFQAMMRQPRGTILHLYSSDGEGTGFMGCWMVGIRTLWDVTPMLGGEKSIKSHNPEKLYHNVGRFDAANTFDALPPGAKARIIATLRKKHAERGALVRWLMERLKSCGR